jgi:hypothetical protein
MFENDNWREIIRMTDDELLAKGVAALGARRKMLKVFEQARQLLESQVHYLNERASPTNVYKLKFTY